MGETQEFTPEQMMAMLLTKLRDTAEKGLKTKVVDVVVSVCVTCSYSLTMICQYDIPINIFNCFLNPKWSLGCHATP